jgi:hypothetical protein
LSSLATVVSRTRGGLFRGWHQPPQIEEPGGRGIVGQVEKLGIIAPEKLADATAEAVAVMPQFLGEARPFAQLDPERIERGQRSKAARVGPQRVRQDQGIPAVILRPGR